MATMLFVPVNKFFGELQKYQSLLKDNKYQIAVVSKDIISDIKVQKEYDSQSTYVSKYKNIDFVTSIFPSTQVTEFRYAGTEEQFYEAYKHQLIQSSPMKDLISLIDLMVTDDINVIMMMSNSEYLMGFIDCLREFCFENFKLKTYSYEDFIVEPDISVTDMGNVDDIKKMMEFHINDLNLKDQITGSFMNTMYQNMESEYIKVLNDKPIDELIRLASSLGIYVSKTKPKADIVEHIVDTLLS